MMWARSASSGAYNVRRWSFWAGVAFFVGCFMDDKKISVQDLKKAAAAVADAFGLEISTAYKIIGFYNAGSHKDLQTVAGLVAGDFSAVPAAAVALGVALSGVHSANNSITDSGAVLGPSEGVKGPKKDHRKSGPKKEKKTGNRDQVTKIKEERDQVKTKKAADDLQGDIEKITGDFLPPGVVGPDVLPASLPDDVENWLVDWSQRYNIDLEKCAGLQWRAACIYIGQQIQKSGILLDHEKMRVKGIKIYNPVAVAALLPVWEYFTNVFRHVPLASDFISFSGVSREYFYNSQGVSTSGLLDIAKKARTIEESGLSSGLVDGRENPTGKIFYSKARLGWRESVEIVHTSGAAAVASDDLPDLSGKTALIDEKS